MRPYAIRTAMVVRESTGALRSALQATEQISVVRLSYRF